MVRTGDRAAVVPDAGPDGHEARTEILAVIRKARKDGADLPAAEDIRRRYATGAAFAPGETGAYLLAWLEEHEQAGHWTATTIKSYRSPVVRLFLPAFGKVPLDKLATKHPGHVRRGRQEVRPHPRGAEVDGPGSAQVGGGKAADWDSDETADPRGAPVGARDACSAEERLLTVNVADGISFGRRQRGRSSRVQPKLWTMEREKKSRREFEIRIEGLGPRERFEEWRRLTARPGPVMVWRPDQLGAFLDAAAEHRMYALFCLYAYLAFRRAEGAG